MRRINPFFIVSCLVVGLAAAIVLGSCQKSDKPSSTTPGTAPEGLSYSADDVKERVVDDYGKKAIRIVGDQSISHPEMVKDRNNCFIVMSKKDYYLYVYEAQGEDTVMVARFDACFSLKKGQKEASGDMRTFR